MNDSVNYQQRKNFFEQMLTIYGRKPVIEVLRDPSISCYKLHLASSNREDGIIKEIKALAQQRGIDCDYHERKALSRISKNGKQDQGVAIDLQLPAYQPCTLIDQHYLSSGKKRLIALDHIGNPQNLGMIIRSVAASGIDGLILPRQGGTALSALVVKASAGTLFKAPIFHCDNLATELPRIKELGVRLCSLSSHAKDSIFDDSYQGSSIYVLGNETEGVSEKVSNLCDKQLCIPMHNEVESLNVAVSAALIAYLR